MDYQQCLDFLFSSLPAYHRVGAPAYKANLDNTIHLLDALGNPHLQFKSIHVAGTNGKGSVSHNLASICQETGYKTGLYTSPHLKSFRERIKINGKMIDKEFVCDFVNNYQNVIKKINPSFFEMTVAMAFLYFARQKVDMAIVEVGMGGRLDSTNVIKPLASVITNIGFDHTQFLGNTLPLIAAEKAGIIKKSTPVIIGETHSETAPVFVAYAKQNEAEIIFADQHWQIKLWQTTYFPTTEVRFEVIKKGEVSNQKFHSQLIGNYQQKNLLTVLATTNCLKKIFNKPQAIELGIKNCVKNTNFQGRWQVLQSEPLVIADTGHNKDGLALVFEQINQTPHKTLHFVLGVVDDKDLTSILPLFPKNAIYYFCKANITRGLDAKILCEKASVYGLKGEVYLSVHTAFLAAKSNASTNDLVFVGGSTFTVAEVV